MDKKHNFDAENNQTNELEEAQNANFYLTKLILHFEEINKKILELFKIENYDRFYEINKLTEEKKRKVQGNSSRNTQKFRERNFAKTDEYFREISIRRKTQTENRS